MTVLKTLKFSSAKMGGIINIETIFKINDYNRICLSFILV